MFCQQNLAWLENQKFRLEIASFNGNGSIKMSMSCPTVTLDGSMHHQSGKTSCTSSSRAWAVYHQTNQCAHKWTSECIIVFSVSVTIHNGGTMKVGLLSMFWMMRFPISKFPHKIHPRENISVTVSQVGFTINAVSWTLKLKRSAGHKRLVGRRCLWSQHESVCCLETVFTLPWNLKLWMGIDDLVYRCIGVVLYDDVLTLSEYFAIDELFQKSKCVTYIYFLPKKKSSWALLFASLLFNEILFDFGFGASSTFIFIKKCNINI